MRLLSSKVREILIRIAEPQLDAIYKGKVIKVTDYEAIIDLGSCKGSLSPPHGLKEGDEVLVCVKRPSYRGFARLSRELTFVGRYIKLNSSGKITFSRFIRDGKRQRELYALALSCNLGKWGVRWRSSAASAPLRDLIAEVQSLRERAEEILKEAEVVKAPRLLFEGERVVEVVFTYTSKRYLDSVRNSVTPTLNGHHYFKSMGGIMGPLVDYAEDLIRRGVAEKPLVEGLRNVVWNSIKEGSYIKILHELPLGGCTELGKGKVISFNPDKGLIIVKREVKGRGVYDGLNIPKESGDYIITCLKEGDGRIYHFYYGKDGVLKGVYLNISTPIELNPEGTIWYLDLVIDVVKNANGEVRIIDEEEFNELVNKGIINDSLARYALSIANEALSILSEEISPESLNKLYW